MLRPAGGGEHSGVGRLSGEISFSLAAQSSSGDGTQKRSAPDSKLLSAPLHLPPLSSPAQICFLTFKLIYWPGLVPPPPLAGCPASAPSCSVALCGCSSVKVPGVSCCSSINRMSEVLVKQVRLLPCHCFHTFFYWQQVELENEDKCSASVHCKWFPVFHCDILGLITSPG